MTPYSYEFPRPALTADCLVFSGKGDMMKVLLIERLHEPFRGSWAFPGGFVNMDETVEEGAARELYEETGLQHIELHQLHTFSRINRDPRGRTVSVAFWGMADETKALIKAGDDAARARWFPLDKLPPLAFDHAEMLDVFFKEIENNRTHS